MHHADHLVERGQELIANCLLRCDVRVRGTNVVDTLKNHGVGDSGLCEHIAIYTAKGVGAQSICQDAVSTCGFVDEGNVLLEIGGVGRLQPAEDVVGPAVVFIVVALASVGDAVANDGHGACAERLGQVALDRGDEVPVLAGLGGIVGGYVCVCGGVAGGVVGVCPAARVACDVVGCLARGEV